MEKNVFDANAQTGQVNSKSEPGSMSRTIDVGGEKQTLMVHVDRVSYWTEALIQTRVFRDHDYWRASKGAIIMFDVTNRESFDHIKHWLQVVERYAMTDCPKAIVGNKIDLVDQRVVSRQEVEEQVCGSYDLAYFETSAKDDTESLEAAMNHILKPLIA